MILKESKHKYSAPDFLEYKIEDYKPAFIESINIAKQRIDAIVNNTQSPNFSNTIVELEYASRELSKVSAIFYNLNECATSDKMQQIAEELSPLNTEFGMYVLLNAPLFAKVKAVYQSVLRDDLSVEELKLLEDTYKSFSKNGANLNDEQKQELSQISERLSLLKLEFNKNVLSATNEYALELESEVDLVGLPDFVKEMGKEEALVRGSQNWVFTLKAPVYVPFMQYSERRDLREKLWRAYNSRCIDGEYSNIEIVKEILSLRLKKAKLLSFDSYSDYALSDRMAKSKENVMTFLEDLLEYTHSYALKELEDVQKFAREYGFEEKIMPWDFLFFTEKYKEKKYSINSEVLKPYFQLESVRDAIFSLAETLYGLCFRENADLPLYHPDAQVYEVFDADGKFKALLYLDFFPRESKRNGAWMTNFRDQSIFQGEEQRPFVQIVMNFTKPTASKPALLTFDELTTFLHEFGHALHSILSEGAFPSMTGTSVARDFVELPSQLMENWAYEEEFLSSFARHFETGEIIPKSYLSKLVDAKNFQAAYACVRQLSFGLLDMHLHNFEKEIDQDLLALEHSIMEKTAVLPLVDGTVMFSHFSHIFSGGYSAGYYSYKWAELLEADTFELFKEKGIFNREVADSFRVNILSKGGSQDADILYRNFRGRDPQPESLIRKMDLK